MYFCSLNKNYKIRNFCSQNKKYKNYNNCSPNKNYKICNFCSQNKNYKNCNFCFYISDHHFLPTSTDGPYKKSNSICIFKSIQIIRHIPCNVAHSNLLIHLHSNIHFLPEYLQQMSIQVYLPVQQFL